MFVLPAKAREHVFSGVGLCVCMDAGTFQKVVQLGLKNERSRREDRGAKGT